MTDDNCSVSKMQTILLVDDDRSIRIAWKRILQLEGYRVETASDGDAGLDMASMGATHPRYRGPIDARYG